MKTQKRTQNHFTPIPKHPSAHVKSLESIGKSDGKMEHAFSVEMKSRKHVRHMSMSSESHATCCARVLFEGSLGELEELSMVEGAVLEVKGANGVLRIDLSEDELRKMLSQKKAE